MPKPHFAILRFAKYKGPEIGRIEAHNERTKETYASNPNVDTSRSHLNFHLVKPRQAYRAEAEAQITTARCRTRKDSVRMVEVLITASPDFFQGKKQSEIRAYFEYDAAYQTLRMENAGLKQQVDASKESVYHRLDILQQLQEFEELRKTVETIPPEILQAYQETPMMERKIIRE